MAAVTYWCQGKKECQFSPSWLKNGAKNSGDIFYFYNQGSQVKDFLSAVQNCGKFGSLARLNSNEIAEKVLKLLENSNLTTSGFWIDAFSKKNSQDNSQNCLVLFPSPEERSLKLKWENCFDTSGKFGALCQGTIHKLRGHNIDSKWTEH